MKYHIENHDDQGQRLVCPVCHEELYPIDVENFNRCPYCDARLESNPELEDFIIDGLVRHWMNRMRRGPGA